MPQTENKARAEAHVLAVASIALVETLAEHKPALDAFIAKHGLSHTEMAGLISPILASLFSTAYRAGLDDGFGARE